VTGDPAEGNAVKPLFVTSCQMACKPGSVPASGWWLFI